MRATTILSFCFAGALGAACAKSQPAEAPQPTPDPVPAAGGLPAPEPTLHEFDQAGADEVVQRALRNVKHCAVKGTGVVDVIFDGNKGRIVGVDLKDSFPDADDQAKQCVKNAFTAEYVPPFKGGKKVVPVTIQSPDK